MPDKGILGYCCTEDEQLLDWLNPAHLLCGSVSLFLEHVLQCITSTQMTTAKSSTSHDFSKSTGQIGRDCPQGHFTHIDTEMQAILQKGEYLAHSSLLENRLIGCQNISVISRKGVWQGTNLETAVKFQKCLTRTFLLVLVG